MTHSRKIKFTTVEFLPRRTARQLANSLKKVLYLYARGGFIVRLCLMDREFEPVKDLVPIVEINTTAAREHVGLIERRIRVVKEKTRASSSQFPFENIPVMVLIHTVYTAVFWLNAFPNMSEKQWFSPREIITGLTIDYKRDCKAVVGAYVEASTDAEITNDNSERRQSCIYLGPAGNRQGSSKCFVIETGAVVVRRIFDVLPYPDAILKK